MSRIKVKPEGRKGVYTCEKSDIIEWLKKSEMDMIHNYSGVNGVMLLGADWSKLQVIEQVSNSDRIGILTGNALIGNLRHGLSVITGMTLEMFDIGEITEDDLEIGE